MNKCFEGIQKLHFETDLKITGMYSSLGEFILFDEIIDPIHIKTSEEMEEERIQREKEILWENHYNVEEEISKIHIKKTSVRNVELWLKEVEKQMRVSLMSKALTAAQDLKVTPKKEWIWKWAGQIVLLCNEIDWTQHVELAIWKSKSDGLKKEF